MNGGRFCKLISVVITGIIAMIGLPCKVLADTINAPTYYSVQSGLSYEITTNITSSWINHESIDLFLINTGSETIHNWYLTFNTPYNIDNIWNGALYETDGNGTYTITSNGWNQDIHSGESVTVGITLSSDTEEDLSVDPEWYLLNTQATVVDASQYTLEYTEYSAWETGFTGQLTLTPQVDCQHWELSFDSNRVITAVSSALLISEGENNYAITHDENNMRLFTDTAYNFGIQGVNTEDPLDLSNVELTVVDLAYSLTEDTDVNGIPDYLEFIGGSSIVVPPPTPTPTPVPTETPTITPTEEPTGTPTTEPSGTETPTPTEEPTPTSVDDSYNCFQDNDGDGLLDYQEIMYMTDPDNPDTDGDGLLDGDEISISTSPNLPDTNGNGLIDFDEDYDGDGIFNGGEYATGTCMFAYDSDYDGINDYNEIYFYGIDPRNEDSDSDGIKDGDEVTLGLNPGSCDSDGDGITDDFVMFSQYLSMAPIAEDHPHEITGVSISGSISGLITSNTTIEDTYNRDMYCTEVYGRVGVPINIESEGHFDSMILTINYDESALGDTNEADLGVLWYDEDTGFFITQEQAVVDTSTNVISIELNHFSTYIVVDLNKWNDTSLLTASSNIYEVSHIQTATQVNGVYSASLYEVEEWVRYSTYYGGRDRNLTRLATIEASEVNNVFGGCFYYYTWLVVDNTDNDSDGIYDYLETNGVMGTNRHLYYANPNKTDSDDDTLSDKDEIGAIYELSRSADGRSIFVKINNELVFTSDYGVIPSDSYYAFLNDYFDMIPNGGSISICVPKSDPRIPDSDEDGYSDSEDARPAFENENVVYMFCDPDHVDCSSRRTARYRNSGLTVILRKFCDRDSFINAWDGIGLYDDFYIDGSKMYGDKYYYNAQYVIINSHGSPDGFMFEDLDGWNGSLYGRMCCSSYVPQFNESADDKFMPAFLSDKRIETLCLYSCSTGGEYEEGDNIAVDFINKDGIDRVIAPDVELCGVSDLFFFRGFRTEDIHYCSSDGYNNLLSQITNRNDYTCRYYLQSKFLSFENARGFVIFEENGATYDFYDDDVFYCNDLYTTYNNYEYNAGGILYYETPISEQLTERWHDPVIDN